MRKKVTRALLDTALESSQGLGQRLGIVRRARELSLENVAANTQGAVDIATLSRLENGKTKDPRLSTLQILALAYNVDFVVHRNGALIIRGTGLPVVKDGELVTK